MQRKLERELERVLGMDVKVVVRTRDELAKAIDADPFGDAVDKPSWYQVTFLAAKPAAKVVRDLEGGTSRRAGRRSRSARSTPGTRAA